MDWLTTQLEQAKSKHEYVLIAMHVPPGLDGFKKKDFWHKTMLTNGQNAQDVFLSLIEQYQDQVKGLISSHTHMDGVRKLYSHYGYSTSGKLIAVDISVPGITPGHGNNPGMKIISYNPENFELLNFTTLYEPFFPAKKVVRWGMDEFDFQSEFGCKGNVSIFQCLDTLNKETLQNGVQSIYRVKNGRGNADEVNSAIDVRFK